MFSFMGFILVHRFDRTVSYSLVIIPFSRLKYKYGPGLLLDYFRFSLYTEKESK